MRGGDGSEILIQNTRMRMCRRCGRFDSGPAHHALKRKYSQAAGKGETLREPANIRTCKSSPCKDVRTRGGKRLPERRDGFRIIGLVMSIILSHIGIGRATAAAGGVRGGAQPFPGGKEQETDGLGI